MNATANTFDEIVNARRSVRVYDDKAPFDESAVMRSLERATLAPNSSNLQLWEFYRIKNTELKAEIAQYCFNQPAARTANELIVFVTRLDHWKDHAKQNAAFIKTQFKGKNPKQEKMALHYYEKLIPQLYSHDRLGLMSVVKKLTTWIRGLSKVTYRQVGNTDLRVVVHKSTALAAQTFMLSMKAEGYDTCPMEGFDSAKVKQALNLPAKAEICMIVSTGKGKPEGIYGERFRIDSKKLIFEV